MAAAWELPMALLFRLCVMGLCLIGGSAMQDSALASIRHAGVAVAVADQQTMWAAGSKLCKGIVHVNVNLFTAVAHLFIHTLPATQSYNAI